MTEVRRGMPAVDERAWKRELPLQVRLLLCPSPAQLVHRHPALATTVAAGLLAAGFCVAWFPG